MRSWTAVLCLAFAGNVASAQSISSTSSTGAAPPAEELQRANAAFVASNWAEANALYSSITKRFPMHAIAKFRTGVTLAELGKPAEGEVLLREGERLGVPAAQAAYRLAESLAEQWKADGAIAELKRAAAARFVLPLRVLEGNEHLADLKKHAEWKSVIAAFDAVVHPCMHDPKYREFDFWVGDWVVRPNGAPSAPPSRNSITLEENGCVVQEHWVGAGGGPFTGQSFSIFDRTMGKWRQTWVDNSGGQHDYVGSLVNGNMEFEGSTPAPPGQAGRIPTRLTLFNIAKDTVRQRAQRSTDGGQTWTTTVDLIYVRKP